MTKMQEFCLAISRACDSENFEIFKEKLPNELLKFLAAHERSATTELYPSRRQLIVFLVYIERFNKVVFVQGWDNISDLLVQKKAGLKQRLVKGVPATCRALCPIRNKVFPKDRVPVQVTRLTDTDAFEVLKEHGEAWELPLIPLFAPEDFGNPNSRFKKEY